MEASPPRLLARAILLFFLDMRPFRVGLPASGLSITALERDLVLGPEVLWGPPLGVPNPHGWGGQLRPPKKRTLLASSSPYRGTSRGTGCGVN
jgi:hypothetical protein